MKTILITGAASGIGLELTRQLLERGDKVIAVCRKPTAELKATKAQIVEGIELTADDLEAKLKAAVGGTTLDWLMNNAGIFENDELGQIDPANVRRQIEVNTIAPLRVTQALLGNLKAGSKIGITTSRMGSIDDNTSGGYYGYRISKAAVNMLGKGLAVDLAPKGINVALLHPGYVRTKMTGGHGEITAEVSAKGLIKLMDQLSEKNSGGFWHTNGQELNW